MKVDHTVSTNNERKETLLFTGVGILIITMVCFLAYGKLFFDPNALPWGSDTLGHVFRFEYLKDSIQNGIWLPDFVPEWYLNIQLFRYYPPYPYYLLALLSPLFENPILLSTWFIVGLTWLGGITWLLFHKWIGWFASILGGVCFLFLPDLLRVAFAEGNILRHFTSVLLPLLVYLTYTSLLSPEKKWPKPLLAVGFAILVLSHPMMASITAAMFVLYIVLHTLLRQSKPFDSVFLFLIIVFGVLLASFWLLPSLTGGITELSKEAMIEGLPVVSLFSLFTPATRQNNIESLYIGYSLILGVIILGCIPAVRKEKNFWAFAVTGIIGSLLVTPVLNKLYYALPLSTLMWPARFLTVSSIFLLLAVLWGFHALFQSSIKKTTQSVLAGTTVLLIVLDFSGSLRLIFNRWDTEEFQIAAKQMQISDGWRQATIDYSQTGSGPSYFVHEFGGAEQLFGWAFQGARTATFVSSINEALLIGRTSYAIDRLQLAGIDDLWIANKVLQPYGLDECLENSGYQFQYATNVYDIYHQDGKPRAILSEWDAVGIGNTAQNYAYLFPQIITMDSPYIDDYALDELKQYELVIFAGFFWHNRDQAETLVQDLAQTGTKILIDLTHSQENPLSQQPYFLDVWGERVILDRNMVQVTGDNKTYMLSPFHADAELWYTITPQNLDAEVLTTTYLNQPLVITGYRQFDENKVWFVGLNLAYHGVINNDPVAVDILSDLFGMPPMKSEYDTVVLQNYMTNGKEISFDLTLEKTQPVLLPFAHFDGTQVKLDGETIPTRATSTMIQVTAPAGTHHYSITFHKTSIYWVGSILTILAIPAIAFLTFWPRRHNEI